MAYNNHDKRLRGRGLQATRLRIWTQDPHCAMCRRLVAFPRGFELDHIKAVNQEVDNSDDNLQVLCVEVVDGVKTGCHVDKTAADLGYVERAKFDEDGRVRW
jgi:5-methylcytosine-specific restriction protein A